MTDFMMLLMFGALLSWKTWNGVKVEMIDILHIFLFHHQMVAHTHTNQEIIKHL